MIVVAVLLGLAIGSFVNVVIVRLPEHRSLWRTRSACPACGAGIAWRDNVPLLSFALLRGRCRACAVGIPWRYPIVEAVTAALFAIAFWRFGPTPEFVVAAILLAALVAITAIDLQLQIIPDAITLPGIVTGLVANVATQRVSIVDSLIGIALGGGLFLIIILVSRGGMGGGDMKLGAMLGAFLGWKVALLALFLAVLFGGTFAIVLLVSGARSRKDAVPFGPFLALGGAIALFAGEELVTWYLSAFGG
jgi:leader peptidase (prepilin peptidase) / N-methyltransferase